MPRHYCSRCAYPEKTCLCDAIVEMRCKTRLVILQHPSEAKHAKNTARLVKLVIPETELVVGETADDFRDVRGRLKMDSGTVVLYPAPVSTPLAEAVDRESVETLIIIDGTWRKAKKMWLENTWLHDLRVCHLNAVSSSAYSIRSTSVVGGMASIEAVAHGLELLGETTVQPLWNAFMAMQKQWPGQDWISGKPD